MLRTLDRGLKRSNSYSIDDNEVNNMEDQFNECVCFRRGCNMSSYQPSYLQAWTINEVFGNQGRKVVLYKQVRSQICARGSLLNAVQQWNSLADCQAVSSRWYNNQFPGELVVPGFKCFQCSKDLPEDVVTNNCKDGLCVRGTCSFPDLELILTSATTPSSQAA